LEIRSKLAKASNVLTKELERDPTPKEIAKKTGLPIKTITKVMGLAKEPLSLETPMATENLIENLDLSKQAQKLLSTLTPREEKILRMRFGIGEKRDYTLKEVGKQFDISRERDYTLKEVGKQFDISRERVRQIEEKALRKARWRLSLSLFLHEEVDTEGGYRGTGPQRIGKDNLD
jgi:RNA polymerase primary sigma factor